MSGLFNGTNHGNANAVNAANNGVAKRKTKASAARQHDGTLVSLTDDQVRQIRALFDYRGWSKPELAKHFDLKYDTVHRVVDGLTRSKIAHSEADVPKGL